MILVSQEQTQKVPKRLLSLGSKYTSVDDDSLSQYIPYLEGVLNGKSRTLIYLKHPQQCCRIVSSLQMLAVTTIHRIVRTIHTDTGCLKTDGLYGPDF